MFCWNCGKKIRDTMLYCPFCGTKMELPEQEAATSIEQTAEEPVPAKAHPRAETGTGGPANETPVGMGADEAVKRGADSADTPKPALSIPETPFVPLEQDESIWNIPDARIDEDDTEPYDPIPVIKPRVKTGSTGGELHKIPNKPKSVSERAWEDDIPKRRFDPNDMFMDREDDEADDHRDRYDSDENEGFVLRHIRGFVALGMIIIVLAVLIGWAFSTPGQKTLAQLGIVWDKAIYAELAEDAVAKGQSLAAADYYSRALEAYPDRYSYAYTAAVLYFNNGDTARAEVMAKRAAAIDPSRKELRDLLERLYPDPANRPADIAAILGQTDSGTTSGIIIQVGG